MKVSFSCNHDGETLVLVDGKVLQTLLSCEGYSLLVEGVLFKELETKKGECYDE